jgi:hypothetical protein
MQAAQVPPHVTQQQVLWDQIQHWCGVLGTCCQGVAWVRHHLHGRVTCLVPARGQGWGAVAASAASPPISQQSYCQAGGAQRYAGMCALQGRS